MTTPGAGGQTPKEGPAAAYTVPWARLRAWIDDKEAWEKQHRQPAPLSDQELAAISQLVPFDNDEPSVSDKDHISYLMRGCFFFLPLPLSAHIAIDDDGCPRLCTDPETQPADLERGLSARHARRASSGQMAVLLLSDRRERQVPP